MCNNDDHQSKNERPKCDRCDNPATMMCVDIVETYQLNGFIKKAPLENSLKHGCDDRPVYSEVITSDPYQFMGLSDV